METVEATSINLPETTTAAAPTQTTPTTQPATPTVDFKTYLSAMPEKEREIYVKNGVDSFEKQNSWVKGLLELKGKKGLVKPSENASEEEKKAYKEALYKEIGRPDNGEYSYVLPEGSNEKHYSDDFMNKLATVAYDAGIGQESYQKIVDLIASEYNKSVQSFEKYISEVNKKLGEDKIDDSSRGTSLVSKESMRQEALEKRKEAERLANTGDYKTAEALKKESDELYARYVSVA